MADITVAVLDRLLGVDFGAFLHRSFQEIYPGSPYQPNWHIEVIADRLLACQRGDINRLIINLPPRHLKSFIGSVVYVAWILGHNPSAQILCVSYAQDLAEKFARDTRQIMSSAWYKRAFRTRLSSDRNAVHEFYTTRGGVRLATSVTGVVTGRGADYIILDDLMKPDEAISDVRRKSVNDAFDNSIYSRLNDKRIGRIIAIMQRLHLNDLVGHLMEKGGYEVLRFPAIAEVDVDYTVETLFGPRSFTRWAGDVLHPAREPREILEEISRTIGSYNFAGQYQQRPSPIEGGLVKVFWLKSYTKADLPARFDRILQSWDTASKAGELNSFSVCTTWGVIGDRYYLLDVFRAKLEFPDLKRALHDQAALHKPSIILIEEKGSGIQLIQVAREENLTVIAIKPVGDKIMRLHAQTPRFESGNVFLPAEALWRETYIAELTMFPASQHADQVDSTSQALTWQGEGFPGWGIFEYYQQHGQTQGAGHLPAIVRLKSPETFGTIITGRGKIYNMSTDLLEVTVEDALELIAWGFKIVEG